MKKIITLVLALAMCLSCFAGCGGEDSGENGNSNNSSSATLREVSGSVSRPKRGAANNRLPITTARHTELWPPVIRAKQTINGTARKIRCFFRPGSR